MTSRTIRTARSLAPARTARARNALAAAALLAALAGAAPPAAAHPHVWVTVETTVVYDNGTITGLRHTWTFDEFYTAMAIEGLDTNKDGKYSREELAELAQVNIDGLKDFAFFTQVRLGDQPLAFQAPKDYWLEHGIAARPANAPAEPPKPDGAPAAAAAAPKEKPKSGLMARLGEALFGKSSDAAPDGLVRSLSLHFTLPLKQPVLAEAQGFAFAVSDPTFFIALDFAKTDPVKLGPGAPAGCRVEIEALGDDTQKLGDAFARLGAPVPGYGAGRPIKINCGPRT